MPLPILITRPPGSEWLYTKLYCGSALHEDIIIGPMHSLVNEISQADLIDRWFFTRYADPEPHIRLRFRGKPKQLTHELLPLLCVWANALIADDRCLRWSIDTYEREVERYGGEYGIDIAERLFSADSQATIDLLRLLNGHTLSIDQMTLAVLSIDNLLASLGMTPSDQLNWLQRLCVSRHQTGSEYRKRNVELRSLLRDESFLLTQPGGEGVIKTLIGRRMKLTPMADQLQEVAQQGLLTQPISAIYQSVVHMHCNRLLGLKPGKERLVLGLLTRTREGLQKAADLPIGQVSK